MPSAGSAERNDLLSATVAAQRSSRSRRVKRVADLDTVPECEKLRAGRLSPQRDLATDPREVRAILLDLSTAWNPRI